MTRESSSPVRLYDRENGHDAGPPYPVYNVGGGPREGVPTGYGVALQLHETGSYLYIGQAATGTATSAAKWQIKRLDTSNPYAVVWADGDADYDNVWDDHESLTYS